MADVVAFAAAGNQVALATPFNTLLYKQDGRLIAEKSLLFPGDITSTKAGVWALSLGATPRSDNGEFLGREEFPGLPPRLIELGTKLKLGRRGFPIEEEDRTISGSRALGRTLSLAWSGDRLYAAELANYTVYEFGSDLKLRATFRDPELALENDGDSSTSEEIRFEKKVQRTLDHAPSEATKPDGEEGEEPKVVAVFNHQQVIRDIAWHAATNRLAILVKRGVLETGPVLDLLDPQTGEVERFHLRMPDGSEGKQPVSQLAVGKSYLWLRAHSGSQETWRVGHAELIEGQRLAMPEVEILSVEEEQKPADRASPDVASARDHQ